MNILCAMTDHAGSEHTSEPTGKVPQRRPARPGPVTAAGLVAMAALAGAGWVGCAPNQAGDLRAESFGDLSHPVGERTDAKAALVAACGESASDPGAFAMDAGAGRLLRRPYLQRLTEQSVNVLWTTAPNEGGAGAPTTGTPAGPAAPSVLLTRPGGARVGEIAAERDESVPARLPPQWIAKITGLAPGSMYCYEVRAGDTRLWRAGFRTAPSSNGDGGRAEVRFVALGDSGTGGDDQREIALQMRTVPFDFMLHTGDLAYDRGTRDEIERHVFSPYADLFDTFAFFPTSGNHEYDSEGAAPFREAFDLPPNGGPDGRERWYSFDWGEVHFVALDTERVGATQAAWLDADLARNRKRWTVAYLHKPPFSSGEHGSDAGARRFFVPLFERYRVPLVLAGHDHHYERTTPQGGVTYVVTGGGGKGTRPTGHSTFTAFAEQVIHFVYVTVSGDTLTLHAIDGTGQEFDSVALALP